MAGKIPDSLLDAIRPNNFELSFPGKWEKMAPEETFLQIEIMQGSLEYETVKARFLRDNDKYLIKRIFKLQNK